MYRTRNQRYTFVAQAEGTEKLWHGHVTAVTVSPEYRRLGIATNLMAYLEKVELT
jgi:N-terminal acetyltransferase B complex catalytic subunit